MQVIDLMLFFAIASMVWGLQYANQSTMGSQAREVNTNSNAEEALNFVRAVQRGGHCAAQPRAGRWHTRLRRPGVGLAEDNP